jgi:hypothetical protein
MNYNINNIDLIQNILNSLQSSLSEPISKKRTLNMDMEVPTHQALYFAPQLTDLEATKHSHIITYRDNVISGPLNSCFEFRPVRKLFWTGLRASWTRNVPAKYSITALSNKTDMKYVLYDSQEVLLNEWIYLPSVIPAFDMDDYRLFLEFQIPKETRGDKYGCDLVVRMAGFEKLIDIGDKQCILASKNGLYNVAIYNLEDSNYATMALPCCDNLPNIRPNCSVMPQWRLC